MIIYGSSLSMFVRKAIAFAREKDVAFELARGGMGAGGEDFAQASPFGKMPALRDPGVDQGRDFTIADSSAICHYLEAKHPHPALIPADPIGRARTIWLDEFGDTILAAAVVKMFFNRVVAPKLLKQPGDEAAAATAEAVEVPRALEYLETVAPATDGGFLVGETLSLADLAVASPFVNLAHVGWTIDAVRWPRTNAYIARMLARPSFALSIAAEQRTLAGLG
ncbi:MAG TPA: glutathione S-transferase family protein [Sphingomonas sp.]|jgi:glutathione S-transferase|nr:glutathione S-transferase family protein [Sphingomonas sp.]